MKISKAEASWLISLICIAAALFLEGCADTVPVITPSAGCIQSCRYEIKCGDGEVCDYGYRWGSCNSPAECDQIKNSTKQIKVGNEMYDLYRFPSWDVNKQTCTYGDGDKYFPSQLEETCGGYDNQFCSYVQSKAPTCLCDADHDHDCDGVPDTQDKCQDVNDPLRFEDIDGFEDEDGCADIDNDKDGICDAWVTENHLESKFFKSKGCVGGIGKCCMSDGVDNCPNQVCDATGNPDRCTKTDDPHYGCKSDIDLLPANQFSATVSPSYASDGTEFEPVARFLSFGPAETHFPGYNVITFKITYGKSFTFADKLKVRWTVTMKSVGDQAPQIDPLIGETGWDAVNQKPEDLKITFLEQKASERGHAIAVEVKAEIKNLSEFVDGVYDIKVMRIEQTGADLCVQKGLDGGTATDYNACHYESLNLKTLQFTSDHQDADGNNLLKRGDAAKLWVIGAPYNTAADPYEYRVEDGRNNPISHTYDEKMVVKVDIAGISNGDRFSLEGMGDHPYSSFPNVTGTWNGPVTMTASANLPLQIGILKENIVWTISGLNKTGAKVKEVSATSGPHTIYVTYDTPIETTSLPADIEVHPPWLQGKGIRHAAENKLTDKKLDILLAPYSEETWGIAGGLSNIPDIVEATHKFLNDANIIISPSPKTCFDAAGQKEYMWSAFSGDYSLRCLERAFLMEIFLGSIGINSKALQIKSSNTSTFEKEYMSVDGQYKSKVVGDHTEWLLMDFSSPDAPMMKINAGEGATQVDLDQDKSNPTPNEKFYPHAVGEKDDLVRQALVSKSVCGVMKHLEAKLGFDFQRWCKQTDGVTWDCGDREPLPACSE